ncbi:MAG: hypothetical protein ACXW3D_09260 [Caulobacteraceae bacterium]
MKVQLQGHDGQPSSLRVTIGALGSAGTGAGRGAACTGGVTTAGGGDVTTGGGAVVTTGGT